MKNGQRTDGGKGKAESVSCRLENRTNHHGDYDNSSKSTPDPRDPRVEEDEESTTKTAASAERGWWAVRRRTETKEDGSQRGANAAWRSSAGAVTTRTWGNTRLDTAVWRKMVPGEARQSGREERDVEEEERRRHLTIFPCVIPSNQISTD